MAKSSVKDLDLGFREIEKQLKFLDNSYVLVGIQEGKETKSQVKGQRLKRGGVSMAQIGYENEYGHGRTPARPFIRSAIDMNRREIFAVMQQQYSLILAGKQKSRTALQTVGVYVEGLVKQRIRAITTPPNAPYTIAKKGSAKPLIDFGQLIQSIANVVFMK